MKIVIKTGISSTKKSAESKKCNWLKKISEVKSKEERVKLGKILKAIKSRDLLLGEVLTDAEVDEVVVSGERPGRGKSGGLRIEIDV